MKRLVTFTFNCRLSVNGDVFTSTSQYSFCAFIPEGIDDSSNDVYHEYLMRLCCSALKLKISQYIQYDTIDIQILSIDDYEYAEVGVI